MLSELAELRAFFGPFRLFGYTSSRVVFAALTAFILMMVIMPGLITTLRRLRFGERGAKGDGAIVVDNMRQAKAGTPTMGGVGIIVCSLLATVLWCDRTEPRVWLLVAALAAFGLLGYLDDRTKVYQGAKGLKVGSKLLLQFAVGAGCGLWFLQIDTCREIESLRHVLRPDGTLITEIGSSRELVNVLCLPFVRLTHAIPLGGGMVLWVMAMTFSCSNAVNFTDGLDGLAAGTMLIAAIAFAVIAYLASNYITADYLRIAYVAGDREVAVFCATIIGACVGFLWFNSGPAEVFMGDTGSQALGGSLAVIALCTKQEFLILLVGFVFFMEATSVMLQVLSYRLRGGKRIFLCAPIHHHFQYRGWPESKIVVRFWMLAALTAILALATLKLR
jgi:phospho-N-acetylmuramoyl-pentapeptide-transferase